MKITCIQLDMIFEQPDLNFAKVKEKIAEAMKEEPDVLVLPETWNTGFFPRENLKELCDRDGQRVKQEIGALARLYHVNIVAGSVANLRDETVCNTAYIFDREGNVVGEYDKTHLFTPMKEHEFFEKGSKLCRFELDGHPCAIIICYDIRFPELTRTLAVKGLDTLFVVSQWPDVRIPHLLALVRARAIENQMFVACCNSCGKAGETVYGGHSTVCDPWGETLVEADGKEAMISAVCDMSILTDIRSRIGVFNDRRPELYDVK